MTQPPYVPPRGDDSTTSTDYTWPPAQETPVADGAHASDTYIVDETYVVDDTYLADTSVDGEGPSTTDVAKDQAGAVKDTTVEQGQQVAGVAKEQAAAVKDTAVEQGQQVAGVAKEQVSKVAAEASTHAKDLLTEGLSEVRSQAASQQQRLASGIHSLAGELGAMASKSDQSGPLTDYAHQASAKGGEIAHWLENAEPSEVLDALRSFARRRPVAFLAASALAGVVVGRLTRGFVANAKEDAEPAAIAPYTAQRAVEPAPVRENISLQEIPTSGSYVGPTTDAPDYGYNEATLPTEGTITGGVDR